MQAELIGRDVEIADLQAWLVEPWGRLVLLEGHAGIGKTTVWRHASSLAAERGYRVVTTSPAEAERQLVFAGLTDLLGPLLPEVAELMAPPRRRAIEAALLLDDGEAQPPDERAVAFAALDVLRLSGRRQPLVLAIDDAQWLDPSSLAVVAFALRRLDASDRVAVLAARRTGVEGDQTSSLLDAVDPTLRTVVTIGPLSLGAVHRLYRERLGLSLPRPRIVRIQEVCAGNPMFALEIGRALAADPGGAGGGLPIPASLSEALGARLSALSEGARIVALLAAAAAEPTAALLVAAAGEIDAGEAISELVRTGVFVVADDPIRFEHPLLASVAYARSSEPARREVHAALAGVVAAPEERARHLALATAGPDASAAAALDEAADIAAARGAQAASGELHAFAAETTPAADVDGRARRLVAAGQATYKAGDIVGARELLERVASIPGPRQHEALWRLGILLDETAGWEAARPHAIAALATEDLELRVQVQRHIATTAFYVESVESAAASSAKAVEAAERLGDTSMLAYALATDALVRSVGGDPRAPAVLAAAIALDPDEDLPELEWSPLAVAAHCAWNNLDLAAAQAGFARVHELAVARGDFQAELWSAYGGGQVALDRGAWVHAQEQWAVVNELTEQSGLATLRLLRLGARLAAHRGDAATCRALTEQCLAAARSGGERFDELQALSALGVLELSEGDLAGAASTHEAAHRIAVELGVGAPGILRFVVDQAEALAGLGRVDEADAVLETFERRVVALDCAPARPLVERARGIVAAARGDLEGGAALLRAAADGDLPLPLERARIDLCLGRVLRRLKRRGEAREALDRALAAFESLGARLWAEQARAERARIGGRSSPSGLTPTEAQVAALVVGGSSNKEVAAALFVTVNTVEAHLSRVYKKLGVRSRGQLARALAEQGPGVSGLSAPDGPVFPPATG